MFDALTSAQRDLPRADPAKGSLAWLLAALTFGVGIVAVFFDWRVGLVLIIGGVVINYASYRLNGGAANPNLMKGGSSLYEREGRRVLEWAPRQRAACTKDAEPET